MDGELKILKTKNMKNIHTIEFHLKLLLKLNL